MLYLVGLGLGDVTDIGLKARSIVEKCERVYLEAYTSILFQGKHEELEEFYGRSIISADREYVEQRSDDILAGTGDVALLVVGDPLGATTHTDLMMRARGAGVGVTVLNNASVLSAVACLGLGVERFGEVVSVCFWEEGWRPESFYDKIAANLQRGMHTLCLLDIKVKEQTVENIIRGRAIYEPPRFMRTHQAASQLLAITQQRSTEDSVVIPSDTRCVACVRLGTEQQLVHAATLQELGEADLGAPLHSLVVCAPLTPLEDIRLSSMEARYARTKPTPKEGTGTLFLVGMGESIEHITIKGAAALKESFPNVMLDSRRFDHLQKQLPIIEKSSFINDDNRTIFTKSFAAGRRFCPEDPQNIEEILSLLAAGKSVAVLIPGDPLVFTRYMSVFTHLVRTNADIKVNVVHNSSTLMNAIGSCGLQLYNYGKTVQLLDESKTGRTIDKHCIDHIDCNFAAGKHTLLLLNIDQDGLDRRYRSQRDCGLDICEAIEAASEVTKLRPNNIAVYMQSDVFYTSTIAEMSKFPLRSDDVDKLKVTLKDSFEKIYKHPNIDILDTTVEPKWCQEWFPNMDTAEYIRRILEGKSDRKTAAGVEEECVMIIPGEVHPMEAEALLALTEVSPAAKEYLIKIK